MKDLCIAAVHLYGERAQLRKVKEELCELVVAVSHWEEKREGATDEVLEEIADVEIMLEQLKVIVSGGMESPLTAWQEFRKAKDVKIKRLSDRVRGAV
jgi:hypothetical protein